MARCVFIGLEWTWFLSGTVCLVAAYLLLRRPDAGFWNVFNRFPAARWALGLIFPGAIAAFKLAQFHSYQLMWDSGVYANLVWNVAHGHGLRSSVIGGQPYFVVHATFLPYLLAPLLWLWNSTQVLAVAQGLALGSSLLAAYLIARRLNDDARAAWLVVALAGSTIYFHDLLGATIDSSPFAPPLFLWSAYFFMRGKYIRAAILAAILLSTREHAAFILAGAGLYLAATRRGRMRWLGCALTVACAALWIGEMGSIFRAQALWPNPLSRWQLFDGVGSSPHEITNAVLFKPWLLLRSLVWPLAKLLAVAKVMLAFALFPLFSGASLLPALTAWLPNQAASLGSGFQRLDLHYSSFIYGPLVFASAKAVARLSKRLAPKPKSLAKIYAWGFVIAGAQFIRNADFLLLNAIPQRWSVSAPKALAAISPQASVWTDDFLLPHLCLRESVKSLPTHLPDRIFESNPFQPDRVLMSLYWLKALDAPTREKIMGFLKSRDYRPIFRDEDLLLWGADG